MNALRLSPACLTTAAALLGLIAGLRAGQHRHRRRHLRQGDGGAGSIPTKRPYSPWAGRSFPTRPLFGDTHLHTIVLHGCRRLRRAPHARATPIASPRARRSWPRRASRQAVAAARLPRRHRPFRQHGLLPGPPRRQARTPRRSAGPQLVRHDPVRPGRRRRRSRSSPPSARASSRGPILYSPRLRGLPLGLAGDDRGGGGGERSRPLHRLHRL